MRIVCARGFLAHAVRNCANRSSTHGGLGVAAFQIKVHSITGVRTENYRQTETVRRVDVNIAR